MFCDLRYYYYANNQRNQITYRRFKSRQINVFRQEKKAGKAEKKQKEGERIIIRHFMHSGANLIKNRARKSYPVIKQCSSDYPRPADGFCHGQKMHMAFKDGFLLEWSWSCCCAYKKLALLGSGKKAI